MRYCTCSWDGIAERFKNKEADCELWSWGTDCDGDEGLTLNFDNAFGGLLHASPETAR